jgi:hypothetical protein
MADPLYEMADEIQILLQSCTRLQNRLRQATDLPLIVLAQECVAKLTAQVQSLRELVCCHPSQEPFEVDRIDKLTCAFQSSKTLLFEILNLLNLCAVIESSGEEGALNAIYSYLHNLNDIDGDTGGIRYQRDRIQHSAEECHAFLSRWFGPEATVCYQHWGLDPKPVLEDVESLEYVIHCFCLADQLLLAT